MNAIDRMTGSPANQLFKDEYVYTCSLCPEMAHGTKKFVYERRSEHEALTKHTISFIRNPCVKTRPRKGKK